MSLKRILVAGVLILTAIPWPLAAQEAVGLYLPNRFQHHRLGGDFLLPGLGAELSPGEHHRLMGAVRVASGEVGLVTGYREARIETGDLLIQTRWHATENPYTRATATRPAKLSVTVLPLGETAVAVHPGDLRLLVSCSHPGAVSPTETSHVDGYTTWVPPAAYRAVRMNSVKDLSWPLVPDGRRLTVVEGGAERPRAGAPVATVLPGEPIEWTFVLPRLPGNEYDVRIVHEATRASGEVRRSASNALALDVVTGIATVRDGLSVDVLVDEDQGDRPATRKRLIAIFHNAGERDLRLGFRRFRGRIVLNRYLFAYDALGQYVAPFPNIDGRTPLESVESVIRAGETLRVPVEVPARAKTARLAFLNDERIATSGPTEALLDRSWWLSPLRDLAGADGR